jgi:DNA repair exonuclease SbcCD ATPase subunit
MQFNWIKIKNFKRYGDYETTLTLSSNEVRLFIGENGSGKTSFVDAIIWALYGRSISAVDDIVNRETKKDCKVELNFTVSIDDYAIIRYRAHTEHGNKLLLFKNGENISRRIMSDTQDLIEEIIQIQYHAMVSSTLYSSELYISFLRAKVTDRLKIIESILSLKEIQEYYEATRELRKPLIDKMSQISVNKEKYKSEIEANEKSIEEYKNNIKKKLMELKVQKDKFQNEIEHIKTDLEVASHINFDQELSIIRSWEEIVYGNKQILFQIEEEKKNLVDITAIANKIDEFKNNLEELASIDVDFELGLIKTYREIEKTNLDIDNDILKLKNKLFDVKEREKLIDFRENEIELLRKETKIIMDNLDKCPRCGQDISADLYSEMLKENRLKISNLSQEIVKLANEVNGINVNNEKIKAEINTIRLKKIPYTVNSIYSESELRDLGKKKEDTRNKVKILRNSFIEKESFNNSISNRIANLKDRLNQPPKTSKYGKEYLESLKVVSVESQEKISNFEKEIALINERAKTIYDKKFIEGIEKRIRDLNKDQKDSEKEMENCKSEDLYFEILQQIFSNKTSGVKKYIIDKMLAMFNEKVNFYLPFFFDDEVSITFDKDLNEIITIGKSPVSFSTLSSGEKTRFELAIAFSLFMLVKTFFSTTINLLIFDEILDQNLDKRGIQAVLEIIEALGKDNSVIVISHREELREYFTNQILVSRDKNGFSRLAA